MHRPRSWAFFVALVGYGAWFVACSGAPHEAGATSSVSSSATAGSGGSGSTGQGGAGGSGQGGAGGSGQGGAGGECQVDPDCPASGVLCEAPRCEAGVCNIGPAKAGTACPEGACDANGLCVDPCRDTVRDGDETDVDCGGPTCGTNGGYRCDLGAGCLVGDDCLSGKCCSPGPGLSGTCIAADVVCSIQ